MRHHPARKPNWIPHLTTLRIVKFGAGQFSPWPSSIPPPINPIYFRANGQTGSPHCPFCFPLQPKFIITTDRTDVSPNLLQFDTPLPQRENGYYLFHCSPPCFLPPYDSLMPREDLNAGPSPAWWPWAVLSAMLCQHRPDRQTLTCDEKDLTLVNTLVRSWWGWLWPLPWDRFWC